MNFFRGKNRDPKNGNTLWATTFFRVVRSGYRLKIWTVHIHTRDHASAFLRSRPGKQSCRLFLVCARYVSDQATRTSNFSPPAASRYSAARRLEEMSSQRQCCEFFQVVCEPILCTRVWGEWSAIRGALAPNEGLLQNHFRGHCRVQNPDRSDRAWRHFTFGHFSRFAFLSCSSPIVHDEEKKNLVKEFIKEKL